MVRIHYRSLNKRIMKKNNRKNCGRKKMDWIDKKSQIQLTIPNEIVLRLTKEQGDNGKRAMAKLMQTNLTKVIESIAN